MNRLFIALVGILIGGSAPLAVQAANTSSLCEAGELTLWSCTVKKNKKTASLCGSKGLSATSGYVQYRYGKVGHVELVFPNTHENTQKQFRYSRYTRPLTTYLSVRFKNNGVDYGLEYTDRDDPAEMADMDSKARARAQSTILRVSMPKGKETEIPCDATGTLMSLEDVLPNEEF